VITWDRLEALRRGDATMMRSILSSLRIIVAHLLALGGLLRLVSGIRVDLVTAIVNGVAEARVNEAGTRASKALRVTRVMTRIGRLLQGVSHLLFHTVRLLGPALIVELLGRVLRWCLLSLGLRGPSSSLHFLMCVLRPYSEIEKLTVLCLEKSPLEPQDKLWVDDWCRLWTAAVDLLRREVL
jgi:hypothetical protein